MGGAQRAIPPPYCTMLAPIVNHQNTQAVQRGQMLDYLRHTLQHRPRIMLMFSGAHTFAELGPVWTDRFISARRLRVSFLKRDESSLC